MVAKDRSTGVELWKRQLVTSQESHPKGQAFVDVSPAGDRVVALIEPKIGASPFPRVTSFDAATGSLNYEFTITPSSGFTNVDPKGLALSQNFDYLTYSENDPAFQVNGGGVLAINPTTGATAWSALTDRPSGSLSLDNQRLYVGSNQPSAGGQTTTSTVTALALATGQVLWQTPGPQSTVYAVDAYGASGIVAASFGTSGDLLAMNASTGAVLRAMQTGNPTYQVLVDPAGARIHAPVLGPLSPTGLSKPLSVASFGLSGAADWSAPFLTPWGTASDNDVAPDGIQDQILARDAVTGALVVAGSAPGNQVVKSFHLRQLDPSNGSTVATATVDLTGKQGPQGGARIAVAGSRVTLLGWGYLSPNESKGVLAEFGLPGLVLQSSSVIALLIETADRAGSLSLSPDGSILLTTSSTLLDVFVTAVDAVTGGILWGPMAASTDVLQQGKSRAVISGNGQAAAVGAGLNLGGTLALTGLVPQTAAVLWKASVPQWNSNASSIVEAGVDRFFTATDDSMDTSLVRALDAATGATLWSRSLDFSPGGEEDAVAILAGQPVVVAGQAYLGSDVQPYLSGFHPGDGSDAWTAVFTPPAGKQLGSTLGLARNQSTIASVVRLDSDRSLLIGFASANGVQQWSQELESISIDVAVASAPDGSAFVVAGTPFGSQLQTSSVVEAIDAATGTELWTRALDSLIDLNGPHDLTIDGESSTVYVSASVRISPGILGSAVFALDLATGDELWRATYPTSQFGGGTTPLQVALDSKALFVATTDASSQDISVDVTRYQVPRLTANPSAISLSSGGVQRLDLRGGSAFAGTFHALAGSATGTAPGIPLDGLVLPLVFDAYTLLPIQLEGGGVFSGGAGVLDSKGLAQATISLPAGTDPALAGVTLFHAWLGIDLTLFGVSITSNPTELLLAN
ncbi:PQQ-binding-like beta-propeller repeat protein [Engelhardtia mirabilis]|uniref:Outer membrane biogenesis protein BamB n=1 Tax=Engelhardtia mirabilis TaxID=2528011 RepID=A0A518BMC2_9BACT|nr:outer membrane biogenesis protein BamB [Planctomycetes bacterium Pla133]QDV02454.1 outer membrane biogenesis protein BamB [Planctomycetes bacterium Pla86]